MDQEKVKITDVLKMNSLNELRKVASYALDAIEQQKVIISTLQEEIFKRDQEILKISNK